MPISYRISNGTAIIVWERTSGVGVRMPAIIKLAKMACRLLARSISAWIRPNWVSARIISGNSKVRPNINTKVETKDTSLPADSKGCISSVVNPSRKSMPTGSTAKKQNAPPIRNRAILVKVRANWPLALKRRYFLPTKPVIKCRMTGRASTRPISSDTLILNSPKDVVLVCWALV